MSKTKFEIDKEKLEVRIIRVFKTTPEKLWKAHVDAEQIPKWWDKTTVDKLEAKVGGAWRFVSQGEDGREHAFRGEFKELEEPTKMVRTFEYEPIPGRVLTETMLFEDQGDGTTKYTATSKYDNLADLEGMVAMGMEDGAGSGLERLAELVES